MSDQDVEVRRAYRRLYWDLWRRSALKRATAWLMRHTGQPHARFVINRIDFRIGEHEQRFAGSFDEVMDGVRRALEHEVSR